MRRVGEMTLKGEPTAYERVGDVMLKGKPTAHERR